MLLTRERSGGMVPGMTDSIRKITPMAVYEDIGPALSRYERLGFEKVGTDDDGCVGVKAGKTALILVSAAYLSREYDDETVKRLVGQTIPYIWVQRLDEAEARLPEGWRVVGRVEGGVREVLVSDGDKYLILAETPGR